jgi:hypothetical protein
MSKILTIKERQEQGTPHHPNSIKFYMSLSTLDFNNGDVFGFKAGGDGDNGEHLMYLMDVIFDEEDQEFWAHSDPRKTR